FFVSGRRRHTSFSRDWSSDVCSSDLRAIGNIVIDAREQPVVTRYDIELRDMQMASFLKSAGLGGGNTTGKLRGRIELTGEGATVRQSLATADGRIAIIIDRKSAGEGQRAGDWQHPP